MLTKTKKQSLAELLSGVRLAIFKIDRLSRKINYKIDNFPRLEVYEKEKTQLVSLLSKLKVMQYILEIIEIRVETILTTNALYHTLPELLRILKTFNERELGAIPELSSIIEPLFYMSSEYEIETALAPNTVNADKVIDEAYRVLRLNNERLNS
ncbi:hypothetical protein HS7_07770 [Sulfolobales archaeon HS-7]|nr:hypothetical protein HS7_07770 [Sulfolobales archaeon HS-7]